MAQLAIKGHSTRGSEVIALLEMLGGKNTKNYSGYGDNIAYFIFYGKIDCAGEREYNCYKVFTLEEFEEKFPYKVGDKVSSKYLKNYKIEKIEWEDTNNRVIYKLQGMGWYAVNELQPYKEETMKKHRIQKEINEYLQNVCIKNAKNLIDIEETLNNDKLELPNNVIINRSGICSEEFIKWYILPQYPKTYEECCEVLFPTTIELGKVSAHWYNGKLLEKFGELLTCRAAYWKIAREQMGLDKPWEPDYNEESYEQGSPKKYVIYYTGTYITKGVKCTPSHILAFPTEEMRDAFYENFKELIETVKELL